MYHHIVPLAAGGRDTPDNMTCLCGKCHDMIHFDRAGRIDHNTLVKAGIHAAQERGVHFGRKPLDYEKYMQEIAGRSSQFNPFSMETEMEIAESLGIKTTTYYKIKRMLLAAIRNDSWPYEWQKPRILADHPEYAHVILKSRKHVVKAPARKPEPVDPIRLDLSAATLFGATAKGETP